MSKDVELDDEGNIIEKVTEVVKTDSKGRWVKGTASPNPRGRGKNNQSKLNKTKMVTSLNKHGLQSIGAILRIAKKAEKIEQLPTAMKGYAFVAEQYLKAVAQQDRMAIELQKLRAAENKKESEEVVEDEEESNDLTAAIFNFQRVSES